MAISLFMVIIGAIVNFHSSSDNKKSCSKFINALIIVCAISLSVILRQNSVIILIALVIMIAFSQSFSIRWKSILIFGSFILVLIGTVSVNKVAHHEGFNSIPSRSAPAMSWINMSWNPRTYGQIEPSDSSAFSNLPKKQRSQQLSEEFYRRVKKMGPNGIAKHLIKKATYMFSIGGSNEDLWNLHGSGLFIKNDIETDTLRQSFNNFFQPFYIFILLLSFYGMLNVLRSGRNGHELIFDLSVFSALSIMGIFVFHVVLWEVRDRYALPIVPFILVFSAIGISQLPVRNAKHTFDFSANKHILLISIALIFLVFGFISGQKYTRQSLDKDISSYQSGFMMYTEGGTELSPLAANTKYLSRDFHLKTNANTFKIYFGGIWPKDSKNISLVVTRVDNNRVWHFPVKPYWNLYEGNFLSGIYNVQIENTNNHKILTSAMQQMQTENIQGPAVTVDGKVQKGMNMIFAFSDHGVGDRVNNKILQLQYLFYFILGIVVLLSYVPKLKRN